MVKYTKIGMILMMTEYKKKFLSLEITITKKHLILVAIGILISWFLVPTQLSEIRSLNSEIQRLNNKIKIYEFNEIESESLGHIIKNKSIEIERLDNVINKYKSDYNDLLHTLELIKIKNESFKIENELVTQKNKELSETIMNKKISNEIKS